MAGISPPFLLAFISLPFSLLAFISRPFHSLLHPSPLLHAHRNYCPIAGANCVPTCPEVSPIMLAHHTKHPSMAAHPTLTRGNFSPPPSKLKKQREKIKIQNSPNQKRKGENYVNIKKFINVVEGSASPTPTKNSFRSFFYI